MTSAPLIFGRSELTYGHVFLYRVVSFNKTCHSVKCISCLQTVWSVLRHSSLLSSDTSPHIQRSELIQYFRPSDEHIFNKCSYRHLQCRGRVIQEVVCGLFQACCVQQCIHTVLSGKAHVHQLIKKSISCRCCIHYNRALLEKAPWPTSRLVPV